MLEMDCKEVFIACSFGKEDASDFGCLIKKCKSLLSLGANLKLVFIRRQANGVAHALARAARSYVSSSFWLEAPSCLVEALAFDMNLV